MGEDFAHIPVLLDETLELLEPRPGIVALDGTLGGAGHAVAMLDRIGPDGRLIGLDLDDDALAAAARALAPYGPRVDLVRSSFRNLDTVLHDLGLEHIDLVLFDLGVSSWQIDRPERGFRFARETAEDTPLDMRMDRRLSTTAADLLNRTDEKELQRWFQNYGELPGSKRLAHAIVEQRECAPLQNVADLLALIRRARIGRGRSHNPATLVFQALRIATNDELGALEEGLQKAITHLRLGGRIAVITYHSLEDRIVKQVFRQAIKGCTCPPTIPVCICGKHPSLRAVTRRPCVPTDIEKLSNPRARSAHLRVAERISEAT